MSEANAHVDVRSSFLSTEDCGSKEFFTDKYWECRCHKAEEHLQEIARELEKTRGEVEYLRNQISCLDQERRILVAQLDVIHLIFGNR